MHAMRTRRPDGGWHFQHGPIDLLLFAEGEASHVAAAHDAAWRRFETVLAELVDELPLLRRPVGATCPLRGAVARRMWHACIPHRDRFVTPMAAVAGAVADTVIAAYERDGIARAWINNGGDIALRLGAGTSVQVGLFADLSRFVGLRSDGFATVDGRFAVDAATGVRGVATSGWRGRSFSLGIADSVTVLARTAADADAAATMIANAVDVDDARIVRRPASSLKDDSDLGDRLVTVDVPVLDRDTVDRALRAGLRHADTLRSDGTIAACFLVCQRRATATAAAPFLQANAGRFREAA